MPFRKEKPQLHNPGSLPGPVSLSPAAAAYPLQPDQHSFAASPVRELIQAPF